MNANLCLNALKLPKIIMKKPFQTIDLLTRPAIDSDDEHNDDDDDEDAIQIIFSINFQTIIRYQRDEKLRNMTEEIDERKATIQPINIEEKKNSQKLT